MGCPSLLMVCSKSGIPTGWRDIGAKSRNRMETDPMPPPTRRFVIGSRASKLATIQAEIVHAALTNLHPSTQFALSYMTTEGDKNQSQALYLLGGKSLWTKELEVGLLDGDIDLIVHSLKDVPTSLPEGCEIGAILEREDPCDCLVVKKGLEFKSLEGLPDGSTVGTSSVRRVAQLRRHFPKLKFADVRGNLNTRLAKLDDPSSDYSALILARAGLVRLGFGDRVSAPLRPPTLYHAVGQGALAVEIRSDDPATRELVRGLTHVETNYVCRAERACLRVLEGGCSVPVGAESSFTPRGNEAMAGRLILTGTVTSYSGEGHVEHTVEEHVGSVGEAEAIGEQVARILMDKGAKKILDEISRTKEQKMQQEKEVQAEPVSS